VRNGETGRLVQSPGVAVLDLLSKVVLLSFLFLVVIDPEWGNLAGKAPTARALTYPLLAFAIPVWWAVRRSDAPYPWLPDLLLTLTGFSDILGNRLDLYDRVVWFDDWMHFANTTCVAAGPGARDDAPDSERGRGARALDRPGHDRSPGVGAVRVRLLRHALDRQRDPAPGRPRGGDS
jgi:hypothetical protein